MSDLKQQIEQGLREADVLDSGGDEMVGMRTVAEVERRIVNAMLPIIEATLPPETPPSAETKLAGESLDKMIENLDSVHVHLAAGRTTEAVVAIVMTQHALKRIAAALSSPRRAGEAWQPMETAPKDGTRILGLVKDACLYRALV